MKKQTIASLIILTAASLIGTAYSVWAQDPYAPTARIRAAAEPDDADLGEPVQAPAGNPVYPPQPTNPGVFLNATPRSGQFNPWRQNQSPWAQQSQQLAHKFASATDSNERTALAAKLKSVVEKQFVERQQVRQKQLEDLENKLKQLRATHQRREAEKDRIVEDRVSQLLRDAEGMGWGGVPPQGQLYPPPTPSTLRSPFDERADVSPPDDASDANAF